MTPNLADTPVLQTKRLILRAPGPQDWSAFAAFLSSDRSGFVGGPYRQDQAWRSLGTVIGHWALRGFGMFTFCRKEDDAALGMTGPWYPEGWAEPEIAWSIWDQANEGKGYVAEAADAARRWANETLNLTSYVSYINPANTRSIALAKRLGCAHDGVARLPDLPEWEGTLVYRHPRKEAA